MKTKSLLIAILLLFASCGKDSPSPILDSPPVSSDNAVNTSQYDCSVKLEDNEDLLSAMLKGHAISEKCQLSLSEIAQYLN